MAFTDNTEALITTAIELRDAAVESRSKSKEDANAAAAAQAQADQSARARDLALQKAEGARKEATAAIDAELSVPVDQATMAPTALAPARRR